MSHTFLKKCLFANIWREVWDVAYKPYGPTPTILAVLIFAFLVNIPSAEASGTRAEKPSRAQIAYARRDAYAAIRLVFPRWARPAARCVVSREGGRWTRAAGVGAAGEVGSWQIHPGWTVTGWNGNRPRWPFPWRVRNDALFSTRQIAYRLWLESGRRFGVHWVLSSRACGVR